MCYASLHVANRKATKTETLTVKPIPTFSGWKGLYSTDKTQDQTKLVCMTGRTTAVIKQVGLMPGTPPLVAKAWERKRNVEVVLYNQSHNTWVRFPDEKVVALHSLRDGVFINIGVPFVARTRKPKATVATGMDVIEKALDETTKTPAPADDKVDA